MRLTSVLMIIGTDAKTIALIVIGVVILVLAGFNEAFTSKAAIIPPRLFRVSSFLLLHLFGRMTKMLPDANYDHHPHYLHIPLCSILLCLILPADILSSPWIECNWRRHQVSQVYSICFWAHCSPCTE